MQLIPVIDIRAGQVVHARRGDRAAYAPIQSPLAAGSRPVDHAHALLARSGADTLYVADLDALQGGPAQLDSLRALLAAVPHCGLWLDAGFAGRAAADRLLGALGADSARVVPVFGTESLATRSDAAQALADPERSIVSLDRRRGRNIDAAGCWHDAGLWPQRVIVMTLDRVGDTAGPDLDTLAGVRARARPGTQVIGAGGLRHRGDAALAAAAGASAWLVASALHSGAL